MEKNGDGGEVMKRSKECKDFKFLVRESTTKDLLVRS